MPITTVCRCMSKNDSPAASTSASRTPMLLIWRMPAIQTRAVTATSKTASACGVTIDRRRMTTAIPSYSTMSTIFRLGPAASSLTRGPLSYIVGPWNLSGIWSLNSGSPFTVYYGTTVSNSTGGGTQRPNRIGSGKLSKGQSINHWFDTAAFVAPAPYTFGNSGTGILTGPGYFNVDLTLERHFLFHNRYNLDFRGEAFNAFNHANFNNPNATIGTALAGL